MFHKNFTKTHAHSHPHPPTPTHTHAPGQGGRRNQFTQIAVVDNISAIPDAAGGQVDGVGVVGGADWGGGHAMGAGGGRWHPARAHI